MKTTVDTDVKIAICDNESFYPLRDLVSGRLNSLGALEPIERFLRTVVLHDEIVLQITPHPYFPENDPEFTEEEKQAGERFVITGFGPTLEGYDFFLNNSSDGKKYWVPDIELDPRLLEIASNFANAGDGNPYFKSHVDYLKTSLGVVSEGGSALLASEFGQAAIEQSEKYPASLFHQLDEDWKKNGLGAQQHGMNVVVPPVLGIVLSRAAKREAIPEIIKDLRDEWFDARRRLWRLLDAARKCKTNQEFIDIERELSDTSKILSPYQREFGSRPVRILWEIIVAAAAGAGVAEITGVRPMIGAITAAIGKVGSSAPSYMHEFGNALFGRGAFDLAKRVRREISSVERDALMRLITDEEKRKLGLK